MGYYWKSLSNYDLTDHSTEIYGIRLRQYGNYDDLCAFMSEKKGYDCTGKVWDAGKTEETGYYTWHRFQLNYSADFFDRQLSGDTNIWSRLTEETIEGVVWKTHNFHTPPLYWGGFLNPNNWNTAKYAYVQLKLKEPFVPSKSSFKFSSTGGTDSFELEANTGWTATTISDWVSVSPMTGTTGGTLTLTCNRNYTESARTATITFTNADAETFNITVQQKRGTVQNSVNKQYRNGNLIFVRSIITTKLKVDINSIFFQKTGNTTNVSVKSNIPYTYSCNADWVTIVQNVSGLSVTAGEYTGSTERTGSIIITANNAGDVKTHTISLLQKAVNYVSYIHTTTLSNESERLIDTGIYPTTATTVRIKGQTKGYSQGKKVFGYNETDAGSDQKDYRLIWCGNGGAHLRWDFNSSEIGGTSWGGAYDGRIIDFTCSNNQLYDNTTSSVYATGTTQTSMARTDISIKVDVGSWWLKQLQIWQGDVLVFDGEAAIENDLIGLYDSVSGQLKYNPDLTMGYEA